jgi:hypothetical protein
VISPLAAPRQNLRDVPELEAIVLAIRARKRFPLHIEDLTLLPDGHPPSPYSFPVSLQKEGKWGYGLLPEGLSLCAVGWLGSSIPVEGKMPNECIRRLWKAYKSKLVVVDGTAGWHDCELCEGHDDWYPGGQVGPILNWRGQRLRVRGYGHFLVRSGDLVYIAPVLILHYILDHGYKAPDAFVEAVIKGDFMEPTDLNWVGELAS